MAQATQRYQAKLEERRILEQAMKEVWLELHPPPPKLPRLPKPPRLPAECVDCGVVILRPTWVQLRCKLCGIEVNRRRGRERQRRIRSGIPLVVVCLDCGCEIPERRGNPRRCVECRAIWQATVEAARQAI
jgi:hypothetical protein